MIKQFSTLLSASTRLAPGFPLLAGVALSIGVASAAEPDLCEGLPTHTNRVPVKPVARPPFMKRYRDPAFGSVVMRISDSVDGEVYKPAYSTMQAWNADESLLLLYRSGEVSGHALLDGFTYEQIRMLDIYPSDIEEVFWSHSDPDIFFYVSKDSEDFGEFRRFNVRENQSELIRDFDEYCGEEGLPVGGGDVQMQSLDDDLFGFRCQNDDEQWIALSYRISTDEVFSMPLGEGTGYEDWTAPMPGPSGDRFWMQGRTLSTDLKTVQATMDMAKDHEHSNIGLSSSGEDVLYQVVFEPSPNGCIEGDMWQGVGHLTEHTLSNGRCRPVVNADMGFPYTTSGTHVSAQAWKRPGWVVMSSIGYDQFEWFSNGRNAPVAFSEVYLVNTDPKDKTVCRIAQHRSFSKHAKAAQYNAYLGEPHATISPSGTRVVFGSDWYDSGRVDTYVVELPAYTPPE